MTTPYLLDQTYGYADIPDGWTPVQANDEWPWPQTVGLDVDHQAAMLACDALGISRAPGSSNVRYFRPCSIEACECDEDYPGDWAIRWTAPPFDPAPTGEAWAAFLAATENALDRMTEDDRNDAIEALRSRFDEIYTRRQYGSWPDDSPIDI